MFIGNSLGPGWLIWAGIMQKEPPDPQTVGPLTDRRWVSVYGASGNSY